MKFPGNKAHGPNVYFVLRSAEHLKGRLMQLQAIKQK